MRKLGDAEAVVASLEDLILLKLPSVREKDASDVKVILDCYAAQLDWVYLGSVARDLAAALEEPEILKPLQKWLG